MSTITNTVSQTLESFIKDRGGRVRIHKTCMVAYGLQTTVMHDAIRLAEQQGYTIGSMNADGINSFRYWKEVK